MHISKLLIIVHVVLLGRKRKREWVSEGGREWGGMGWGEQHPAAISYIELQGVASQSQKPCLAYSSLCFPSGRAGASHRIMMPPLCSTPSGALLLPWLARPREAGGGAARRRLMLPTHSERAPRSPMTSCTSLLCPWKFDRATVQQLLQLSIRRVPLYEPVWMQRLSNSSSSFHTCAAVSEIPLPTPDFQRDSFPKAKEWFYKSSHWVSVATRLYQNYFATLGISGWRSKFHFCVPRSLVDFLQVFMASLHTPTQIT